jgi:hypothetical protein
MNSTDWQDRLAEMFYKQGASPSRFILEDFIQQELDASYKRGVEEVKKYIWENCFVGTLAKTGEKALVETETSNINEFIDDKLEQLNQTHREEK